MFLWLTDNFLWLVGILILVLIVVLLVRGKKKNTLKDDLCRICSPCPSSEGISGDINAVNRSGAIINPPNGVEVRDTNKPEWYEILEEELNRITTGKTVFNPPEKMKVGVSERVEVRISRDSGIDIVSSLKGRGVAQVEDIRVSELMKVRLSGSDFDITPLNEEEQFIGKQGFTEWTWNVIPKKRGDNLLHLHVTLRIRLPFGEERKDHPVVDKLISVKVNPIYSVGVFVSIYWKWIASAIIVPLVGYIWKFYTK